MTVPDEPVSVPQRAIEGPMTAGGAPRHALPATGRPFIRRAVIIGGVSVAVVALAAGTLPQAIGASFDEPAPRAVGTYDIPPAAVGGVLGSPTSSKATGLVSMSRAFTTQSVDMLDKAKTDGATVATIPFGTQVWATEQTSGDFRMVDYGDGTGWVLSSSLVKENAEQAAGVTLAPCPRGSAVEKKLRPKTIEIYRSVCALFPDVNSYGGWRAGGLPYHKNGRALDIMLTPYKESALGHSIANYLIAHAKEFNIDHIIFEQHIWTPSTPHWRKMADRGSITANHFNHVHVAIKA